MIRRPPRSTQGVSSAASDVYKRQGEENADFKRRATDNIWSRKTFRLDRIVEDPGQRVLYYLADGSPGGSAGAPERAFVREELMLISEDTRIPPEYVKKW